MTFDGTHIHITDRIDDNVRMILPPSADGQAPTVWTYTVSGLNESRGIAFDGAIQTKPPSPYRQPTRTSEQANPLISK